MRRSLHSITLGPGARILWLCLHLCMGAAAPAAAATLTFTVTASEPALGTAPPRIAIDVGGVTRYATYAAGSGTTALTFSYAVQAGDFDANGIMVTQPLQLNGGGITDPAGNPLSSLAFTEPDTTNLKVQTYTAAFQADQITNSNANAVSFTISKAPTGANFTYAITSSGGAGTVTGGGTISGLAHTVSNVDVSALPAGTLTLSVTVTKSGAGSGAAKTDTAAPTYAALTPVPGVAVAFSTQRMFASYTGALLRVRRSADGTEQDIGFTVGGRLNTAALTSFCGSGSCFVRTWYDQSGNGRHASQSDTNRQPRLVNAGTIETLNGLPAPWFNGSSMGLDTAAAMPASGTSVWYTGLIDVLGNGGGGRGRIWVVSNGSSLGAKTTGDDYYGSAAFETFYSLTPRIVSLGVDSTASIVWGNGNLARSTAGLGWQGGWLGGLAGITVQ